LAGAGISGSLAVNFLEAEGKTAERKSFRTRGETPIN
jgi:hypothetical protein